MHGIRVFQYLGLNLFDTFCIKKIKEICDLIVCDFMDRAIADLVEYIERKVLISSKKMADVLRSAPAKIKGGQNVL
jgi:ribosomal protein L22